MTQIILIFVVYEILITLCSFTVDSWWFGDLNFNNLLFLIHEKCTP